jgi:hypothetical protein
VNIGRCSSCGLTLRSPRSPVRCPSGCRSSVILHPVNHVRHGRLTKCGAACERAKTRHCDCICGGKNHGRIGGYYIHGDAAAPIGQLPPLGSKFEPDLPLFSHTGVDPGAVVTGFDAVEPTLLIFRRRVPSVEVIRLSTIFAGLTIMTGIATAERAFACIARLYREAGRQLPALEEIKPCIDSLGLHVQRRELYEGTAEWAPQVRDAMLRLKLRDGTLRRHLYMNSKLPRSIGLAKLSFVLALCGNDVCCLDVRILKQMFGPAGANKWSGLFNQSNSERALMQYEHVEAQFLSGNPYYRQGTTLGKARCQWMSWESVGNPPRPASHSAWADVVHGA